MRAQWFILAVLVLAATPVSGALASHWPLDETTGTVVVATVGANGTQCGNNALCTPPGGPLIDQTGHIGRAYSFDGVNDCLQFPDSVALSPKNATFAFWFNGDSLQVATVASKASSWTLALAAGILTATVTTDGVPPLPATATLANDTGFHHVAWTWNGTALTVWVDGEPGTATTGTGNLTDSATVLSVAATGCPTPLTALEAVLDDLRFYDQALNASELAALAEVTPGYESCSHTELRDFTLNASSPIVALVAVLAVLGAVAVGAVALFRGRAAAIMPLAALGVLGQSRAVQAASCPLTADAAINGALDFILALTFLLAIVSLVVAGIALAVKGR